jgi:hypothetical protein
MTPGAVRPPGAPAITDPRTDPSTNQPRMGSPSSPGEQGPGVRAASPTKRGSGATGRGAKRQQRRLCGVQEWGATGDRARLPRK